MDRKNPLTNDYPALPELKTRINAAGKSRIFNTAENKKGFNFTKYYFRKWYSFNPRQGLFMQVVMSPC
ncbi:hypothetical protein ABVN80_11025 [Acinetobacter baumannii]